MGIHGHVTGVDPARPDYGAPITLGNSQAHILSSALGPRITFHTADPLEFLSQSSTIFDAVVFAHSLWYFSDNASISAVLAAVAHITKTLHIAEYSFLHSLSDQTPHVLAVKTQARFFQLQTLDQRQISEANIRTALSPTQLHAEIEPLGFNVISAADEGLITPHMDLADGRWEVRWVLFFSRFVEQIEQFLGKESLESREIMSLREQTRKALDELSPGASEAGALGLKESGSAVTECRTMDIWWANFRKV